MSNDKLHPFGIEKTFVWDIPNQSQERVVRKLEHLNEQVSDIAEESLDGPLFNRFGLDPGCVEISSAVLYTMADAKRFFEEASIIPIASGMVHRSDYVAGCGGHIHVDAMSLGIDEQKALTVWADRNPWITAFSDPQDDINVNTLSYELRENYGNLIRFNRPHSFYASREFFGGLRYLSCYDLIKSLDGLIGLAGSNTVESYAYAYEFKSAHEYTVELNNRLEDDLSRALAPRHYKGTWEFRCFDCTSSWAEQKLHIDFAQAVMAYVKANTRKLLGQQVCYSEHIIMAECDPEARSEYFLAMLAELGLPEKPYRRYLDRIEPRYLMEKKAFAKADKEAKIGELQRIPTLKHNELVSRIYADPSQKALEQAAAYGDPRTAEAVRRSSPPVLQDYCFTVTIDD